MSVLYTILLNQNIVRKIYKILFGEESVHINYKKNSNGAEITVKRVHANRQLPSLDQMTQTHVESQL